MLGLDFFCVSVGIKVDFPDSDPPLKSEGMFLCNKWISNNYNAAFNYKSQLKIPCSLKGKINQNGLPSVYVCLYLTVWLPVAHCLCVCVHEQAGRTSWRSCERYSVQNAAVTSR